MSLFTGMEYWTGLEFLMQVLFHYINSVKAVFLSLDLIIGDTRLIFKTN